MCSICQQFVCLKCKLRKRAETINNTESVTGVDNDDQRMSSILAVVSAVVGEIAITSVAGAKNRRPTE